MLQNDNSIGNIKSKDHTWKHTMFYKSFGIPPLIKSVGKIGKIVPSSSNQRKEGKGKEEKRGRKKNE